jgi:hypothetical protein
MRVLIPTVTLLNVLIPIALLWWLLTTTARSRVYFISILLLFIAFMAATTWSIFGFWHAIGTFWPTLFAVALVVVLFVRVKRGLPTAWLPKRWSKEFFLSGIAIVFAVYWATAIPSVLRGRAYVGEPLALSAPLRGGTFYIRSGGANFIVNQHVADPTVAYAMDITRTNAFGLSAAGLYPADLDAYVVFGAEIVAPCAGEVISVSNDVPNRTPLDPDGTDEDGGNHVTLFCQGHSVHLAHMDTGSVAVSIGDQVVLGQLLGRVGNSGNSMEPHLHIGAAVGRHPRFRDSSDQVESTPILIDGRFLIIGDSFTN